MRFFHALGVVSVLVVALVVGGVLAILKDPWAFVVRAWFPLTLIAIGVFMGWRDRWRWR